MSVETEAISDLGNVVEHFRSTGYEGSEPWISELDAIVGTRLVAARQLEACAIHPVCAWLDDADEAAGLWRLLHDCFLAPLESFAAILEATHSPRSIRLNANGRRSEVFEVTWQMVNGFIVRMRTADASTASYPGATVGLLLAAMMLRQVVDAESEDANQALKRFVPFSTNVHPTFLPRV
ncbi:MAG TPA: hypothetical protein VF278_03730, partial [Pirellulales bacterium]